MRIFLINAQQPWHFHRARTATVCTVHKEMRNTIIHDIIIIVTSTVLHLRYEIEKHSEDTVYSLARRTSSAPELRTRTFNPFLTPTCQRKQCRALLEVRLLACHADSGETIYNSICCSLFIYPFFSQTVGKPLFAESLF